MITSNCTMAESAEYTELRQALKVLYKTLTVFCFEVIMYKQVSRCFKTTGSDHSVELYYNATHLILYQVRIQFKPYLILENIFNCFY